MSEEPQPRRGMFESMWPWPGVVLLVLLAAWFFYMGAMADVDDISTAFLGLGGVTSLVALLGLRAANLGGMRASRPRTAKAVLLEDEFDDEDEDDELMLPTQRRAPITAEIDAPPAITANEPIPLRPPLREEPEEEAAPRPLRRRDSVVKMEEAPAPDEMRRKFTEADEADEAFDIREGANNREKAERGAGLARLSPVRPEGEGGGEVTGGREFSVALEERLNSYLTIPAFNAAMNQKVFPQINSMLRKALKEQIGPEALKERMAGGAEDGEDAETSMTLALQLAEARQAMEAHIEEVQKDRKAMREEIRGVRKRAEEAIRQMEERGAAVASSASPSGDMADAALMGARIDEIARTTELRVGEMFSALERLEKGMVAPLAVAPGDEGAPVAAEAMQRLVQMLRHDLDEARAVLERQFAAVEERLSELGSAGEAVGQRLDQVEAVNRRQGRRLNELANAHQEATAAAAAAAASGQTAEPAAPAEPGKPGEVDALRDALTTIIEQNRAIRAQQEMLSARLDPPLQAEDDGSEKS